MTHHTFLNPRRFLITGAGGFVGANLVRRLAQQGEEVHLLVKPSTKLWRLDDIADRLQLHSADLRNAAQVQQVVQSIRPTVIYHLSSHGAYHYQTDVEQILAVNIMGVWNLLAACREVGFDLFVNTGSSSEYGRKPSAMRETDRLDPNSFYAVAKAAQSLLCQQCAQQFGLPIVTLRLFSIYGPYEEPTRLIPRLMLAAIHDTPIDMVSPQTSRDFVYVDDVVDVCLRLDELRQLSGEVVNVGTGQQTTLAQVVAAAEAANGGRKLQARWNSMEPRSWDTDVWVADPSKLRQRLDAALPTTIQAGLVQCLPWFRDHQAWYQA